MTEPLPLPEACSRTMAAVLKEPLAPGASADTHMKTCSACSEARVAYLAQEEAPEALTPAGYFERLPERIQRKLPLRAPAHRWRQPLGWAAAAALLMAIGTASFWAGRANRTPLVEAALPRPAEAVETTAPDTPFHNHEEDAAQVQALTPEEMKTLLKRLDLTHSAQR